MNDKVLNTLLKEYDEDHRLIWYLHTYDIVSWSDLLSITSQLTDITASPQTISSTMADMNTSLKDAYDRN